MPKAAKKSTSRGAGKGATVVVTIDPAVKKRWDALTKQIHDAQKEGASAFDALWEAVAAIVEHNPPLYLAGGYENAEAFFRERLGETRRNAFRFIRVAKFASPNEEEKYGTTKLDAALAYLEAKLGAPLAHPPLPIALERLRIPVKDGAHERRLSLEEARVEDIVAATRALAKTERAPTSSVERGLKKVLSSKSSLAKVTVRVRNGLVTFANVPTAALATFGRVLASGPWDEPTTRPKKTGRRASSPARRR